jgi:hypothetical protein
MEVNIDEKYFDILGKLFSESSHDLNNLDRVTTLKKILDLLTALPINSNIDDKIIRDAFDSSKNEKNFPNGKEKIIQHIVKNRLTSFSKINNLYDIGNYSGFYFLSEDLNQIFTEKGVIYKDQKYDCKSFYDRANVAHLEIAQANLDAIKDTLVPCNAMIIQDKYLLTPFEGKIKNLMNFINLYNKKISIDFHLTLIFSFYNGIRNLDMDNFKHAIKELNQGNLKTQFIIYNKQYNKPDRLIYTNYSSANIGHPFFETHTTVFNQRFMASGNGASEISDYYKQYKKELIEFYHLIDDSTIGGNCCSNFEELQNKYSLNHEIYSVNPGFNQSFKNRIFEGFTIPKLERKKIEIIKKDLQ